jgi:EAL domain-containing protein (putative c-di-GMP-specific phosphodiesterase class I)
MYHTKQMGRSNFHFYTDTMNEHAKKRLSLENHVKQAFADNEFINYYQPIIDAKNKQVAGFELLLRWQSKDGLVSPAEFIPISEELGLIIPMTIDALNRGLVDLKVWQKDNPELYISVNLSAKHLLEDTLIEDVTSALDKHQMDYGSLRLEVTESTLMKDHQKCIGIMRQLSDLGIKLALDDFGTGYSSLQYLKDLPLQIIKIDRSFVSLIGIDKNDEAIIESILLMASSLNKYCVAEGIETKEQLDFLIELGCNQIQGFYFAKPMPKEQIANFIAKPLS